MTINATHGLHALLNRKGDWPSHPHKNIVIPRAFQNSDSGCLLPPWDENFCSCIEDGIRELVMLICDRFSCFTYSSCEGHIVEETITPAHVGIAFGDTADRTALAAALQPTLARFRGAIIPRLIAGQIRDTDATIPCLDLVFHGAGIDAQTYSHQLRHTISRLCASITALPNGSAILPNSRYIGSRLSQVQLRNVPYHWQHLRRFLSDETVRLITTDLAPVKLRRVERRGYSFAASALDHSNSALFQSFASTIAFSLRQIVRAKKLYLDGLELHEMSPGDLVSIHSDQPIPGKKMWRLVLYLDSIARGSGGTHLILARTRKGFALRGSVQPMAGDAVLFAMTENSFHAVSPLGAAIPRRTIVASYYEGP